MSETMTEELLAAFPEDQQDDIRRDLKMACTNFIGVDGELHPVIRDADFMVKFEPTRKYIAVAEDRLRWMDLDWDDPDGHGHKIERIKSLLPVRFAAVSHLP